MRCSTAYTAACTRLLSLSFFSTFWTWILTVLSASSRLRAMLLLLSPRARQSRISRSRGVSLSSSEATGAAAGETVVAEAMTAKLVAQLQSGAAAPVASELDKLTPREREILDCLARGESNKTIARNLELAESTVKIHVQNVLKKLKLSSRVQAAVYAVEHRMQGGG